MTEDLDKQAATDTQPESTPSPEVTQEAQGSEESAEQAQDRILMELDGEPDPDDLVEVGEGQDGEVLGGNQGEENPDPSPTPISDNLEQALQVLRRDGWSNEDLEALPEERLVAIAEHRKKMQADVDRMLRDRQPDADDAPQTAKDSEESHAEPTPDQPSGANLTERAQAFADYLGLDEDGTRLLVEFQRSAVEPMQQIVDEQRAALESVSQQIMFMDIDRARMELAAEYPQVRDVSAPEWDRVLHRMVKLYDDESSDKPTKAVMEDAILLEFKDSFASEAKQTKQQVRRFRDDGMPTVPRQQSANQDYSTPEERHDAVLRILESNDPRKFERARAIGKPNL